MSEIDAIIDDEMVEAARVAITAEIDAYWRESKEPPEGEHPHTSLARAALEAALPLIEKKVRRQVDAEWRTALDER